MLQEPPIPIQRLSEVRTEDVKQYTPNSSITINIRYCKHCGESVGLHYIDDCAAETCSDPAECPYSFDWNGDACGYIICPYCHHNAPSQEWTVEDSDVVDIMARRIGISGEVKPYRSQLLVDIGSKEGSA